MAKTKCEIWKCRLADPKDFEVIIEYLNTHERSYEIKGKCDERRVIAKFSKKERKMLYDEFKVYWDCTF